MENPSYLSPYHFIQEMMLLLLYLSLQNKARKRTIKKKKKEMSIVHLVRDAALGPEELPMNNEKPITNLIKTNAMIQKCIARS